MDDLLTYCLLCALKTKLKESHLPVSSSDLYTQFMKPCWQVMSFNEQKILCHCKIYVNEENFCHFLLGAIPLLPPQLISK